MRWLNLSKTSEEHERFSRLTALFHATGQAIRELDELREESETLEKEELLNTREHLLVVKKDALNESFHGGVIDEEALRELVGEIDAELNALEGDGH